MVPLPQITWDFSTGYLESKMSNQLPLKPQNKFSFKKIWPTIQNLLIIAAIVGFLWFITSLPKTTSIDFAIMRHTLTSYNGHKRNLDSDEKLIKHKNASETIQLEKKAQEERKKYVNESRARMIVESATLDYYRGSYDDALRRLERARLYDPCNFSAFKLSGQIFFEHNKYRKAFNNWERANELPNDDKTIARDLDVLRKLLRYSRSEIDKLRHTVNTKPEDKIAQARLKELEERVED